MGATALENSWEFSPEIEDVSINLPIRGKQYNYTHQAWYDILLTLISLNNRNFNVSSYKH